MKNRLHRWCLGVVRRAPRIVARLIVPGVVGLCVLLAAVRWVPFPRELFEDLPSSVVLTDRAGSPLRVTLGPGDQDSRAPYTPRREDWIVQAIVAAEDQRFWSHPGVDLLALARAIRQNVFSLRTVSGASTLSTQVIRLAQPRPRNLASKAMEAFRALQLERQFTKDEILGQYLRRAPFGSNIVGIETASRRYFGKGAGDLSLAEASLLAGLPQSPSRLRPDRYPARARTRQLYVLERMRDLGFITDTQQRAALAQTMKVRAPAYPFEAPHFCGVVHESGAGSRGGEVRTTLDRDVQRIAESALRRFADERARQGVKGGAVVVLDVRTGALRALVGSPDFSSRDAGQVNAAVAPRSAGSTLKPFVYALALDRGLLTPQSVLSDVPAVYRDYEPGNFDPGYRGLVTMRDALVQSLNMPAIDVERRVGQPLFHATLRDLGFGTLSEPASHYGLGLVLGNAEVRLLDLANAYACLARNGQFLPVRVVEDEPVPAPVSRFSPEACWLVADMLSGDERAMDLTGHAAEARLPMLAWKTGTSAGFRDAWTIAYNPDYVIGVWLGNPDGDSSDTLVGRRVATPIAWDIFRRLYPDNNAPWFEKPEGLRLRNVCAATGCAPGPHCLEQVEDWTITGVTRFESCTVHTGEGQARWSPRVAGYLEEQRGEVSARAEGSGLRIVSPAPGSTFRRLPGVDGEVQRLSLDAAALSSGEQVFWFVNDRYLGDSRVGTPLYWPLQTGSFQLVCSDARGSSDRVQITVE